MRLEYTYTISQGYTMHSDGAGLVHCWAVESRVTVQGIC